MTEDRIAALEARVTTLEALAGVGQQPAAPATIKTLWGEKRYADFPTYRDFAQLSVLTGRGLSDDEIAAWMAATGNGDPRTHTASGQRIADVARPYDFRGSVLPWGQQGMYRWQPGRAGEPTVFTFDAPTDAHVQLSVPYGPFTGGLVTAIEVRVDDGPVEELPVTTEAGTIQRDVAAGPHRLVLVPNADVPELRVVINHS